MFSFIGSFLPSWKRGDPKEGDDEGGPYLTDKSLLGADNEAKAGGDEKVEVKQDEEVDENAAKEEDDKVEEEDGGDDYDYDSNNINDEPEWRRRKLNQEIESNVCVSSFFPIERYYDAAGKVLASFEEAYANNELDNAFVFGKQYCSFVVLSIPQHSYYSSPRHSKARQEHLSNVEVVMKFMAKVVFKMNEEERVKRIEREKRSASLSSHEKLMDAHESYVQTVTQSTEALRKNQVMAMEQHDRAVAIGVAMRPNASGLPRN